MEARPETVGEGRFDRNECIDELGTASSNHDLGTTLRFENHRIGVWEVLLQPGERGPFHAPATSYFWTVVHGTRGLQRFAGGSYLVRDYLVGETKYFDHTPDRPLIHDLENVGDSVLRFVAVEILA